MKDKFINDLNAEMDNQIMSNCSNAYKTSVKNFFKEDIGESIGIRVPILRKISNEYYKKLETYLKEYYRENTNLNNEEVNKLIKNDLYDICKKLLDNPIFEYKNLGLIMLHKSKKYYEKEDFEFFKYIASNYITNWAYSDEFSIHAFYELTKKYPELLDDLFKFTDSKNRWEQRISATVLIPHIRKVDIRDRVFKTADILILVRDDMVEKGIGWLLKVTADKYQEEVYNYVLENKNNMTRTTLRYAIEKMPKDLKKEAMK
ncbi:DNA alkylation repair protein [Methanococcus voltae]|uniref:DNA alkylation repair enzyme n=1 Tax=Methanococcus voltae (strain ATCC BAA-1334 / A3) TaxID=456320 RepID=D7DUS7_METV3|nr:DNA alkylation repair protein [Methanococcus voltae]MCS3900689.1 3-methyladenine DNA glycosylase AlkD [Methanococcus voltae]